MEHKLILGGEQYLPFARSRIKALRATGLSYGSQQYEVDGVSIKVRTSGEHDFIRIEGGNASQYLVTPNNTAFPAGDDVGGTEAVDAEIIMKAGPSLKVISHSEKTAGAVDWKNWKTGSKSRVVSYDLGGHRYNLSGTGTTPGLNGVYFRGVSYPTTFSVAGAAIFSTAVDGVKVERLIYVTKERVDETSEIFYSKLVWPPVWVSAGQFNSSGLTLSTPSGGSYSIGALSAWFFDPTGSVFATVLSQGLITTIIEKKALRGTIVAALNSGTGEYDLTASFVVGEMLGKSKTFVQSNPVTVGFSYTYGVTDVSPEVFVNCGIQARIPFTSYSGVNTYYLLTISEVNVLAIDFLPNGQEVIVHRDITEVQQPAPIYGGGESFVSSSNPALTVLTLTAQRDTAITFSHRYFAGDSLMFGIDFENSYTESSSYVSTAVGPTINAPLQPTPGFVNQGITIYDLDARDSSGIVEYYEEERVGGLWWEFFPYTLGGASSLVGMTPSEYPIKCGIRTYYKGVLLEDRIVYDISDGEMPFGHTGIVNVLNTRPWTYATVIPKNPSFGGANYSPGGAGSLASAADNEFVSSISAEHTNFHRVIQETGATFDPLKTAYTPTPVFDMKAFKPTAAPATELEKVPLYGTPGFNAYKVRIL